MVHKLKPYQVRSISNLSETMGTCACSDLELEGSTVMLSLVYHVDTSIASLERNPLIEYFVV